MLCKCLHLVIGTHGLSNMHNVGNETLCLEDLSVILETSWRKTESAFQKSPPKVQRKHFLADIHISVLAAKGRVPPEAGELFQPFFSLCSGSIKGFMGDHNTLLYYVTWKITRVIKLSFRVSFEFGKICSLCLPGLFQVCFVFIVWFGVAWQRCTSPFLPLLTLLFYEHRCVYDCWKKCRE